MFKDGRYVDTVETATTQEQTLIKMMVGRDLGNIYSSLDRNKEMGDVLLEVKNISSAYVNNVSFQLHKGEVLGFSGLVGAGRTETMPPAAARDQPNLAGNGRARIFERPGTGRVRHHIRIALYKTNDGIVNKGFPVVHEFLHHIHVQAESLPLIDAELPCSN